MRRLFKLWLLITPLMVVLHAMPADGETIAKPPAQTGSDSSHAQLLARIKNRWSDQIEQSTQFARLGESGANQSVLMVLY